MKQLQHPPASLAVRAQGAGGWSGRGGWWGGDDSPLPGAVWERDGTGNKGCGARSGVWECVVEGKERARVSKSAKGSGKEYQG